MDLLLLKHTIYHHADFISSTAFIVNGNPHVLYDIITGPFRQIVFKNGGHYIHKTHANYIGEAILQMVDNNDTNT